MGDTEQFQELVELARRVGLTVRHAHLGGAGGGLVRIKDQRQLFIDLDAEPIDQLQQTARGLAELEEVQTMYVRPDVRRLLDDWGGKSQR